MAPGPRTAHGMWLDVKHPQFFSTPQHPWAPTLLKKSAIYGCFYLQEMLR